MFTLEQSGLQSFLERIAEARAQVLGLVQEVVQQAGETMVTDLSAAAPRGKNEGSPPPPGDGDGPLAESFYVQQEPPPSPAGAAITVRTTQPQKLEYVTQGTGIYGPRGERIRPKTKKALMWPGAAHPVRSVAGMQPNDFVSPVVDNAPNGQEAMDVVLSELVMILEG